MGMFIIKYLLNILISETGSRKQMLREDFYDDQIIYVHKLNR